MRRWQSARQRDLRTVLFTDIVGSTEEAARIGDRAWAAVLARHHSLVRAALRVTDGREEDTAGDGFFATFPRPTDGLACAAEIVRGVTSLGLAIRVGLHAGEVERQDGKATGITVHVAARLMAAAQPGEILASATVRELTAGAGWTFSDRGSLELKGLAEPVHGYALDLEAAGMTLGPERARRAQIRAAPGIAILAASALVLVGAAFLAFRLVGASGGPAVSPSPVALGSPLPTGFASSSVASQGASPSAEALALPAPGAELAPGLYLADSLPSRPTFTIVDPGWTLSGRDVGFVRQTSPDDQLSFLNLGKLANDPCGYKPGTTLGGDPEAQFLAWARANPGLKLSPSEGVRRQFGDMTTTEFDVTIVPRYTCSYTSPISVAIEAGGGSALLNVGPRVRLEITSLDGQLVLIVIQTPSAADFDAFDILAEKILNTIHFAH